MGRMEGKVAVVVGGATGFGLATSERLAAEGATVAILARRVELAEEVAERLGGSAHACDVTDHAQMHEATQAVVAQHGRIDAAVNYAGFERNTPIRDLTPQLWQSMMDVQFTGAVWFIQAMGGVMAEQETGGSIVLISSLTAHNPSAGQAAYAGSKAGLEYVGKIAAIEYGAAGVRVNTVAPALIETPMTSRIFQNKLVIEAVRQQTPLGRMGHVDDIANAVLFFACDESGYVSGETLLVDGAASTQKLPTATDIGYVAAADPSLLE